MEIRESKSCRGASVSVSRRKPEIYEWTDPRTGIPWHLTIFRRNHRLVVAFWSDRGFRYARLRLEDGATGLSARDLREHLDRARTPAGSGARVSLF